MIQFWRTGYETTSVSDLTRAMGITPPSLYAAFGNKENLFLDCVRRYTSVGSRQAAEAIGEAASSREAARQLLESSAMWFTQPGQPPGCLVASAAATGSEASGTVRAALREVRQAVEGALRERAQRDLREGKLPEGTDARALAAMTMALVQGMSTLARDGATREELLALVQASLAAWPGTQEGEESA